VASTLSIGNIHAFIPLTTHDVVKGRVKAYWTIRDVTGVSQLRLVSTRVPRPTWLTGVGCLRGFQDGFLRYSSLMTLEFTRSLSPPHLRLFTQELYWRFVSVRYVPAFVPVNRPAMWFLIAAISSQQPLRTPPPPHHLATTKTPYRTLGSRSTFPRMILT